MIRGKTLLHCHGKSRGKKIATYKSRAQALKVHRTIMRKRALEGRK